MIQGVRKMRTQCTTEREGGGERDRQTDRENYNEGTVEQTGKSTRIHSYFTAIGVWILGKTKTTLDVIQGLTNCHDP